MKTALRGLLMLACLVLGLQFAHAQPTAVPLAGYRVTDLTDTLSVTEAETLTNKLNALEQQTGAQMRILLVSTLGDEPIDSYAKRVFNAWQSVNAGQTHLVVFVLAKHERKMRLQVAAALEDALPAQTGKQILDAAAPSFKKNQFAQGFAASIDAASHHLASSRVVAPAATVTPGAAATLTQVSEPATSSAVSQDNGGTMAAVMLVGFVLIAFVFFMVRASRQKARAEEERRALRRYAASREAEERAAQARRTAEQARAEKAPPVRETSVPRTPAAAPRPAPSPNRPTSARRSAVTPSPAVDDRRYRDDDVSSSSNDFTTAAMLMAAASPAPAYERPARVYEAPAPAPTYYSPPPPAPAPSPSYWSRSDDDSSSRSSSVSSSWGGGSDSSSSSSSDSSSVSSDY